VASNGGVFVAFGPKTSSWIHRKPCPWLQWASPQFWYHLTATWAAIQGCHNGHPTVKSTVRTSTCVRVYPADAVLPADGFLLSADAVKTASAQIRCVRADALIPLLPLP
jgi:hypothetical protein